ncbi:MAG: BREX-3 system P-loop-containing protein BrxF [Acidobacteria bacterium]|nr:BREX-3 system P-loop-containing protein BrxF [Acidobacteriota bacterium]
MPPSLYPNASALPPPASIVANLEEAIQQASTQYYRLVVLAGIAGSGKTAALQSIAQKSGCPIVNVNLEMSKKMLELTKSQRSRQIEPLLKNVISTAPGDVVPKLCTGGKAFPPRASEAAHGRSVTDIC